MCGVNGLRFIVLFKKTFDPLVYENVCMIISLPTKRISAISQWKHLQEFYPQDGGESLLALKFRHCNHMYKGFCYWFSVAFQQFMGMTAPIRREISVIAHPHAAHLPYLPEPRQWLWPFCMSISGLVIFRDRCFNLLYNIGVGGLGKCNIVLHRMGGWSKNTIFALYNMWTAPYGRNWQIDHVTCDIYSNSPHLCTVCCRRCGLKTGRVKVKLMRPTPRHTNERKTHLMSESMKSQCSTRQHLQCQKDHQ